MQLKRVSFQSVELTYEFEVEHEGYFMSWYATIFRNTLHRYVKDVFCADRYTDEYRALPRSLKKKIRALIKERALEIDAQYVKIC